MAGARGPFAMGIGEQRRGARNEQPHMLGGFLRQCRALQQPRVEGRHAHHHGRARHQLDHQFRIEFRQEDHRGAGEQGDVARHEQAMGVIDRQRVDQHVLVREAPVVDQAVGVRRQIVVRQHRALGTAGGARGVEDRGKIVIGARDGRKRRIGLGGGIGQRSLAVGPKRFDFCLHLGRDRADAVRLRGVAHDQRRLGVGDEVVEFVERVGGVERQIHRARAHGRKIQHQRRHRFLGLGCHAVAGLDAARNQHIRHLAGAGDQIAIADARAVEHFDREPVRIVERVEQAGKQVGVGGRVHATFPERALAGGISPAGIARTPFIKQRRQFACQITGNAWPG